MQRCLACRVRNCPRELRLADEVDISGGATECNNLLESRAGASEKGKECVGSVNRAQHVGLELFRA